MKSDSLNGILTFVLGVLVVAGVILALRLVVITKETRQLQQAAAAAQFRMNQVKGVFAAAQAYNQKSPSTELTRILQTVQSKPVNH